MRHHGKTLEKNQTSNNWLCLGTKVTLIFVLIEMVSKIESTTTWLGLGPRVRARVRVRVRARVRVGVRVRVKKVG